MHKMKRALALITAAVMVLMLIPGVTLAAYPELQEAVDALVIPNTDNIRGSITLPSVGENGAIITWESSDESVVSTKEIENKGYIPTPPGHVTRSDKDKNVTLTATISLDGESVQKVFVLTVKALPSKGVSLMAENNDKYIMYYFKGDHDNNERIWIAASEDGLNWQTLNDDQPIIESTLGEQGLRDPYVISNPTGDKFYLIATDLKVDYNGWGNNSRNGSKSIMVWESTDLIHWGDQRMVKVSTDDMGCTWAPEVAYDASRGVYVVYWAARAGENMGFSVFYAETADFVTFTEPKPFITRDPFSGHETDDVIDTTIIYVEGDGYYRFTKNENPDSKRVFLERSDELLGTYEPIKTNIYDEQKGVEGPEIYQLPDGQFCLILDRYSAGGYFPFVTDSLRPGEGSDRVTFTALDKSEYSFPPSPRHGTVVRVSDKLYRSVVKNYTSPAEAEAPDADGSGPILRYTFNDGDARDYAGGGNGKLYGNANIIDDEEKGKVLWLDGSANTYLELPKALMDGRNELTVSMDVKTESTGNFFTFALGQNEHRYLFTRVRPDSVYAAMTVASYGREQGTTAEKLTVGGRWVNVTITVSAEDGSMKIYLDGALAAEQDITLTVADLRRDLRAYIGKSMYAGDGYAATGIDNVEVYGRILSDSEIAGKYTPSDWVYRVSVDANEKGAEITDGMFGLFFEDINYSGDGGLYSEAVNNRSFEAYNARYNQVNPEPIPGLGWSEVGGAVLDYSSAGEPLNSNNKTYLTLTAAAAGDGVENNCYAGDGNNDLPLGNGLNAVNGARYNASLYVRGDYSGTVKLQVVDGDLVLSEAEFGDITTDFTKKSAAIQLNGSSDDARVRVVLSEPGTVDLDMISLIPQETFNGRDNGLRADLVERLAELHPGFLRFPGGCIIEGYNLANRYQWKHTVGPVEQRIQNWSRWQTHNENHHGNGMYGYCQTYGLGFYEYFLLCEDLGAAAVPVVNVGLACQYQSKEASGKDDLYNIYIPDALDLIEFANGTPDAGWEDIDYSTVNSTDPETFGNNWANLRALMGHPESFELEYIGIGNEQFDTSDYSAGKVDGDGWANNGNNFFARYEAFEKAIHERYPDMKLISTSGPTSDDAGDWSGNAGAFSKAWNWVNSHVAENPNFTYAVDEHYYKEPDWPYDNINRYDNYDRNGAKVFAGEYAFRRWSAAYNNDPIAPRGNTVESAISEAAFMTGLEKNSDIVVMASYAPLFAKEGAIQWTPDMIWFNNAESYGSVDYYVQQLYSRHSGDYNLKTTVTDRYAAADNGVAGVGTWLTSAKFRDFKVTNDDTGEVIPIKGWLTSGDGSLGSTGTWTVGDDGTVAQTDTRATGAYIFADMEPVTAENFTVSLKATKTGGDEGFIIPVMVDDKNNLIHWNIGGWGNESSSFEVRKNGGNTHMGDFVACKLETDREYDITIVAKGGVLRGYLDGELINTYVYKTVTTKGPVYANAIKDETTGDVILKLVNSSSATYQVPVDLKGDSFNGSATEYMLAGKKLLDKNDFENPERISTSRREIALSDGETYALPGYSMVVLRIHTGSTVAVSEIKPIAVSLKKGGEYELPLTVSVTLANGSPDERNVSWRYPTAGAFMNEGCFKVYGAVEGTELDAVAYITVVDDDLPEYVISYTGDILGGDDATVTFCPELLENYDIEAGYTGIIALYDGNTLVKVKTIDSTSGTFSTSVTLTDTEGKTLKLMLWKSGSLVPASVPVKVEPTSEQAKE